MRYAEVDMAIAADAEATLPALIEEIKRQTSDARREAFRQRGAKIAEANRNTYERARDGSDVRLGREPGQHRAALDGALGADEERGLVVRHGLGELAAASLELRRSTTSTSAARAPRASATTRRPRSAPRSRTRSTAGSACRFSRTAT